MNVVIYARYSCDNQREESIEGQLRECRAFAERNNYTLIDTYIDRAMSAKTDNRPEFQKMIKDSAKGQFNVIIVWKLDRFARNRYDSAHYKAILRKNGVKVISATEVISEGAEGIILESVLEGYAEYYSAELSEKVIRGMTENALKCQYNGGFVPVGFKIDENKHYQLDELVAPLVREAFTMYVNGRPIKDIVNFFNDNGVISSQGKPLTKTSVSAILQNRKYIGEYKYRDVVVPNGVPAVVSDELFSLAQARLEKNRHAPAAMKADIKYILSTKLRCGDCGGMMVGESGTSGTNNRVYHYYKCANAKKHKCKRKALRKADIEDIVIERTVKVVMNDVLIESISEHVFEYQKRENTVLPLLRSELSDVEKAIGNFVKAIEMGIMTESTMARLSELEARKSDIQVKIAREEIKSAVLSKEQIMFWLHKMRDFDILNEDNRERIVDTFINSVYVYDDRLVINYNCREEPDLVLPDCVGVSSDLSAVGEPLFFKAETV